MDEGKEHEGAQAAEEGGESHPLDGLRSLVEAFKTQVVREGPEKTADERPGSGLRALRALAKSYSATQSAFRSREVVTVNSATTAGMLLFHLNPALELLSCSEGIIEILRPADLGLPQVPPEYFFKGGAARFALSVALKRNRDRRRPRDFDLFRFGEVSTPEDERLAARISPDDFREGRGNGVEILASREIYFASRDLTINEVLLGHDRVLCTFSCLQDLVNRRLRPTTHVRDGSGFPQGIITMKMVRLLAEGMVSGERWVHEEPLENPRVTPFEVALHLERAVERGGKVADRYIALCQTHHFLPPCTTVVEAIEALEGVQPGVTSRLARLEKLRRASAPGRIGLFRRR